MKRILILIGTTIIGSSAFAQHLAFPSAEGFGKYTWGGRGGNVLTVTKLTDDGSEGTLRWAVDQSGARTIVFDISGTIMLESPLRIQNDSITIAGQSAPGDGICIGGNTVINEANQVIIRYMRFRPGDKSGEVDAIEGKGQRDIIIDHCSMSWSTDEVSSWYNNENYTMQWCLLAEPLNRSVHERGNHGYGGMWGGFGATFHHNLIAHSNNRNARLNGARLLYFNQESELGDYVNNVVYNWGNADNFYGGEMGRYNIRNNYYRPGPASTNPELQNRIFQAWAGIDNNAGGQGIFLDFGRFYMSGNVMEGNAELSADNWSGNGMSFRIGRGQTSTRGHKDSVRELTPFKVIEIRMETAEQAYESVLTKVGASKFRDAVDTRIINDVRNRTFQFNGSKGSENGLIDSQNDVGGWPDLKSLPAPVSTAKDGIPDMWKRDKGLQINQNVANDYSLSQVYTNLEMYLNSLVGE
ncbi:MAG: pectate lyase [Bacteroidales bacterium]|nr:pectate lyase [Bacteroidales bacterium]